MHAPADNFASEMSPPRAAAGRAREGLAFPGEPSVASQRRLLDRGEAGGEDVFRLSMTSGDTLVF